MLKLLKQLHFDPTEYVQPMIEEFLKDDEIPISFYAFSTFPSMFGFFTNHEFAVYACNFIKALVKKGSFQDSEKYHDLIFTFTLSIMFSAFSFSETLWNDFKSRIGQKTWILDWTITSNLTHSINQVSRLIPDYIPDLLSFIFNHKDGSLITAEVIIIYLITIFKIWSNFTSEGNTFQLSERVLKFLQNSIPEGYKETHAHEFASLFINLRSHVPEIPSYHDVGHFSLILYFSHADFLFISKTFPDTPLYQLIKRLPLVTKNEFLFTYSLEYFPETRERDDSFIDLIIPLPPDLNRCTYQMDSKFENLLKFNKNVNAETSRELNEYLLRKEINDHWNSYFIIKEINDILYHIKQSTNYLINITSQRNKTFSSLLSKLYTQDKIKNSIKTVGRYLSRIVEACPKPETLILYIYPVFLNDIIYNPQIIPDKKRKEFLSIQTENSNIFVREFRDSPSYKYVLYLVNLINSLKEMRIGNAFRVYTDFFHKVRLMYNYRISRTTMDFSVYFNTLYSSTNSPIALDVYLFFANLIFPDLGLSNILCKTDVELWCLFFNSIQLLLSRKEKLVQELNNIDIEATFKKLRFRPQKALKNNKKSKEQELDDVNKN
ncbi:hypothetical protein GPJ56_005279 [Histomonas meleagridis]|uniref:uncharacterized protein n=1 Tax=Histomonas meleagridis TaxID=135588 RepID=UPI003559D940|nr:hypothetical protein GPJ56_005279 [Histomonas meleagridis]KAH0802128.1 hypothetical protein GO595_005209 [Histomonas meleagridis]